MNRTAKLALAGGSLAAAIALKAALQSRYTFRNKSVLITGGSRGLGLVVARLLAQEGARLTIVGRNLTKLDSAADDLRQLGASVQLAVYDIRDRDQAREAVESAVRAFGSIDVLINNAGIIQVGPLEHMRIEDFENAMATHAWGPLYTMLAAIPHMRGHGGGRIVNISSIGGKIAVPHLLPYAMSKFALAGLSEAMGIELSKYGIHVTTVYPGLMRTGSHVNAEFKGKHKEEFTWFSLMAALPVFSIDARRAARQIVEACRRGRSELIITTQAQLAVKARTLFPNMVAEAMRIVNALLPGPGDEKDSSTHTGWASRSALSHSALTHLADRAIMENNEQRVAS
jgi:NAD(P)-dependent dehydrogenase (short-subunit alcohol dehydrogenase family)